MSRALLVTILCLIAAAIGLGVFAWTVGNPGAMSMHGWIALGLAVVLSGALAGGLMALAFYSSRKGYDDRQKGP